MAKRSSVHPIFDSSFEDTDELLGPLDKDDPNKCQKRLKKGSEKEQHFNFISQPESLFLRFDPKRHNNSEELKEEYSTEENFDVCSQPAKKTEFRTGKKSWQPPRKQDFSCNEADDIGLSQRNSSNKNNTEHYEFIELDVSARTEGYVNRLSQSNSTGLNNMDNSNELVELDVSAQMELNAEDTIQEKNFDKMENNHISQQNLSGKIFSDDDNYVSDFESNKEHFQEENNVFGSMEVHEIDEMIDKKIEDHLSAECEIKLKKNSEFTDKKITINLEDSDDELNVAASNIGEVDKLSESEDKLLQEQEDKLLENSPLPNPNKLKNDSNESLNCEPAENLDTVGEILYDEEENEFDLTISNSQFLQIEKSYTKESEQRKYMDCSTQTVPNFDVANSMRNVPQMVGSVTKYKDCSTQTVPNFDVANSMRNVPQMIGSVTKYKDNVQKLRQCIQELKNIDAILVKARKEIWMQRNTSQNWNSHPTRHNLPPRS